MSTLRSASAYAPVFLALAVVVAVQQPAAAQQQQLPQLPVVSNAATNGNAAADSGGKLLYRVSAQSQRLHMTVNTSRILTMEHQVPKVLVMNPEVVNAQPLSPTQVHISARRTGVTQINIWDTNGGIRTIDVIVMADARELQMLLEMQFPNSAIKVQPLASSVVLSGFVPSPTMVSRVMEIANDYYPNVINNLTVGGAQQVLLHTKVLEVSRTKLRALGVDWAILNGDDAIIQTVSGLLGSVTTEGGIPSAVGTGQDTIRFSVLDGNKAFFGFIETLRQNNLAKVLAEPTLVTTSGRAASFNSGGEFPIVVPQSLGTVSIEYRQFGTSVDFVPIVLGNGNIRLEVRPEVSEIDAARSVTLNSVTVPGLRSRYVDTAVEMKAGQTLALAGLIQNRVEAENRGIPWLADLPWFGTAFRRVEETINEVELLILVTPQFVEAVDEAEFPKCGPGEMTTSPNDVELYFRGYLEVPKCNGCGQDGCMGCGGPQDGQMQVIEEIEHGAPANSPLNPQVPDAAQYRRIQRPQPGVQRMPQMVTNRHSSPVRPAVSQYAQPQRLPVVQRQPLQRQPVQRQPVQRRPAAQQKQPGLIGPVGYDQIR